jgi:uncharacterized integral membrane protein (TIGR00698 family)
MTEIGHVSPLSARIQAVLPGALLAAGLGMAALALQHVIPAKLALPDVLVALLLGSVVVNSPLARRLGLAEYDRGRNRYGVGLVFIGKTVLRASVVLMGLRIEAQVFAARQVLAMALALGAAMPATFFFTHAAAIPLRVPRRLADLIAAGTMICGASAVNAVAPTIGARRQEQGVALATIFLYSAVALVLFRSVAAMAGLGAHDAGIWSGLAVNDLASAVAVGAQMGPGGAEMAAVSKSARVLMLAPVLILFSLSRRRSVERTGVASTVAGHIPTFVLGFLALAVARALGDRVFGSAPLWRAAVLLDRRVVAYATVTISAGIGLHLQVKGLLSAGVRAIVLGAFACATMSGLTLALVRLGVNAGAGKLALVSAASVAGAFAILQLARRASALFPATALVSARHRAVTASGPVFAAPVAERRPGGNPGEGPRS